MILDRAIARDAGGEIKRIRFSAASPVAEIEAPKALDDQRLAVQPVHRAQEGAEGELRQLARRHQISM